MMDKFLNIRRHRAELLVSLFLIVITLAAFWPAQGHKFINYDDDTYITRTIGSRLV